MKLLIFTMIFLMFTVDVFAQKSLKAHTHGHAKINLAADSSRKEIVLELESASKGILGFEWKPHTKKEKLDWHRVQELWGEGVIELDKSKGCKLKSKKIEVHLEKNDDHDHHHDDIGEKRHKGEHSEIHGTLTFYCQKDPADQKVIVKAMKLFNTAKLYHKHYLEEIEFNVIPAKKSPYRRESEKGEEKLEL